VPSARKRPLGKPEWRPQEPFNALPLLPPAPELETKAALKQCIAARAALAGVIRQTRPRWLFAPYWVDAHPDLCDEFNGSRLSHATVLRRGLDYGIQQKDICLVAVRSWEMQEMDLIENGKLNVYPMPMIADLGIEKIAHKVWRHLSKCDAVHISLDIDCLDPAAAPGTGTPEPGGMTMREVLHLLKSLEGLPLVGLDVVEVAPPLDPSESTVFAAIKVIMEFMGVIARSRKQQSK
jgi:arginase family enzyme